MILFEVNARGEVKSTPSRVAQGISMSDLVVLTEDNFDFVTMRLFLPSGELIEDVQFTCMQTEGGRLWHAFMPAKAVKIHGILGYQIFARGINNGNSLAGDEPTAVTAQVITNRGAVRVEPGIIDADMPENATDLSGYTIKAIYDMLDAINAQYGNVYNDVLMHRKEIYDTEMVDYDKPSRIDVLESARPVTGSFSVGDALWTESDDGYTATVSLTDNPLQSGDVMLILPDGEDTRKASADVVVSVKSAENGDEADAIVLTAKSKPAVTTLWYRYAVIKRGAEDTTMLPVASIVGVHDVPTYVTDWIDRVDQAAASNEQKIDNEVERLDGEVERLDERIDNLPQSGGGISVGRGEFTIPKGDWEDDYHDRAKVVFPAETFVVGDIVVVTPANDETREAANSAGLFIRMAMSGDYEPHDDQIMLARATTGLKPTEDMRFVYAVLHTDSDANALVTLIGVDAAGDPAPTLVDLSGFEGVEQEDGSIKGVIVETYADETTRTTEVTYDGEGNIVQIGETVIKWTAAEEEG
jgi:hypothetical protein